MIRENKMAHCASCMIHLVMATMHSLRLLALTSRVEVLIAVVFRLHEAEEEGYSPQRKIGLQARAIGCRGAFSRSM